MCRTSLLQQVVRSLSLARSAVRNERERRAFIVSEPENETSPSFLSSLRDANALMLFFSLEKKKLRLAENDDANPSTVDQ